MCDYIDSSQLQQWLFTTELLAKCRNRANRRARKFLATPLTEASEGEPGTDEASKSARTAILPVKSFAAGFAARHLSGVKGDDSSDDDDESEDNYWTSSSDRGSAELLNCEDEERLIQFYSGKIGFLIGPKSEVLRCRRDVKVAATAALLFRRFFLSNSVMMYDPKAIMVAASFLASKVEDATASVRDLEEGTKRLQAHVSSDDIIHAELRLLAGVHSDLMCFHPFKTVLAYTEDLRTYLKSKAGSSAIISHEGPDGKKAPAPIVSGEMLRPIHDDAWKIVDDACVSDIPLLYTPGQIGLAAMILANEELEENRAKEEKAKLEATVNIPTESATKDEADEASQRPPKIDLQSYVKNRFKGRSAKEHTILEQQMVDLTKDMKDLASGRFGCGNYGIDMAKLKIVHKKLKKCKAWGEQELVSGKKKKRKRKSNENSEDGEPTQKKSNPHDTE